MFRCRLSSLFPGKKAAGRRARRLALTCEPLEQRCVPTVTAHTSPVQVLDHVHIQPIFLGQPWATDPGLSTQMSSLNGFLQYLPQSSYMDMLTWAGYGVGRGQPTLPDQVDNVAVPATITDSWIEGEIRKFTASGPTEFNNLYVVYVPNNTVVVNPWGNISTDKINGFSGYNNAFWLHDSFGVSTTPIHYDVVVFDTSGSLTETTSHEVAESVTDPGSALDRVSWEDDSPPAPDKGHQIGDIAGVEHVDVTLGGYLVQKESDQADQPLDPNDYTLNPGISSTQTAPDGTTYGLGPGGQLYQLQNGVGRLLDTGVTSFAVID